MFQRFIGVLLFFGLFVVMVSGQDPEQQQERDRRERQFRAMQRNHDMFFGGKPPAGTVSVFGRSLISSVDKGFINTILLMESAKNQKIRDEIGLTDEQAASMKTVQDQVRIQAMMNMAKYADRFKKMTDADQATIQADMEKDFAKITEAVEKLATPEQRAKAKTLTFQAMGGLDSPIINIDAVSSLNLSDEQKDKMKKTFDGMQAERVAQLEDALKIIEKAVQLGGPNMSPEDRKIIEAEGKALEARIYATGKKLGDQLRTHLTPEQLDLEKKLVASRPKFLPKLPRQLRGEVAEVYAPGADSWMPGQGAPVQKQKRKAFPTKDAAAE